MSAVRSWLQSVPLLPLATVSVLLALAPFEPEPHIWEKLKMLANGTLTRPLGWLDLLMHLSGLVLVAIRIMIRKKPQKDA